MELFFFVQKPVTSKAVSLLNWIYAGNLRSNPRQRRTKTARKPLFRFMCTPYKEVYVKALPVV